MIRDNRTPCHQCWATHSIIPKCACICHGVEENGVMKSTGNEYIDAALADPANPIKTMGQCCAHVPGHRCKCVCGAP